MGTHSARSQPCLQKHVWENVPDGCSPILLLSFKDVSHKPHWLAHSGALQAPTGPAPPILDHPRVFPTSGGFSVFYLLTGANHCSPPGAPSPKALPGCSLCDWRLINEEGPCLSHYSYSEQEYLRTNLFALTREGTFLHQEVHFSAACGNKRTRFVLTLIRWENREFPKEIKKGKRVGVGLWKFPWSRPAAGVQWGTLIQQHMGDSKRPGRQMKNQAHGKFGGWGQRCEFQFQVLHPWVTLGQSLIFFFWVLSFTISKRKGLNKMVSKGSPSSKTLIFYKWDSGLFKLFFFLFLLFGVSFYLWQQIRNSFRIKEHGMEIIWLLQMKRSTRFRNVLQACTTRVET